MHTKQILSIVGLVVVLGLIAWGISLFGHANPAPIKESEVHILSGVATSSGLEYSESHPYYTVDLVYPETGNQQEQTAIEQMLKQELDDFSKNVADSDPAIQPSLAEGYKLSLSTQFQRFSGAGNTTSYLFTLNEDTGGAHPNYSFRTFVFDSTGKELSLSDLFQSATSNPHADYLNQIAGIATVDVTEQMRTRLGGDPAGSIFTDGLAPSNENYQDWVLDGNSLHFYFPPYQVAAYAAGDFDVTIPLSKLSGILKPEFR
jgi:hypothetical protein